MEREVRQGCSLSLLLFILLLSDIDEESKRGRWRGISLGGEKIYILAYAEDLSVVVEDEVEMKGMTGRLERYLDEKGLEVNIGKTKVMRYRKGGGRWRKVEWRWKGRRIEKVDRYKYLGYTIMRNGGQRGARGRKNKKGRSSDGAGMGDWKKKIWKRLG